MTGKRLALTALLAACGLAATGGLSTSTGQTQDTPGLAYGGLKDRYAAWVRLIPGRNAVAAMLIEWSVASRRCSNNKSYSSTLYAGFEENEPVYIDSDGKFKKTVVYRYRQQGQRYEEVQVVSGTVTDEAVTGSISGRVKVTRTSGQAVRCTFGPQKFRLVD